MACLAAQPVLCGAPDDVLFAIFDRLGTLDEMACACTCKSLRGAVGRFLFERQALLLGESTESHERITDERLRSLVAAFSWRVTPRRIDVSGCTSLSKAALARCLRVTPNLSELFGTAVGSASWSPEQLLELLGMMSELQTMHIDCKAAGQSLALQRLLAHPAVRLRKLVLHRPKLGSLEADLEDEDATLLTRQLVRLSSALLRKASWLHEIDASSGALGGEGFEFAARMLEGGKSQASLTQVSHGIVPPRHRPQCTPQCTPHPRPIHTPPTPHSPPIHPPFMHHSYPTHTPSDHSPPECSWPSSRFDSQVRRLTLSGSSPRAMAAETLARALGTNGMLQTLELGCNFLGELSARALADGLGAHPSLQTLALEHNPLQDAGVAAICDELAGGSSKLTCLSLSFTGAADHACAALARALKRGVPIAECDLGGNLITAAGAASLAAALVAPEGCALRSLGLSANAQLRGAGALELAAALPSSQLVELRLAGCAIGAAPCGRIGAAICRARTLEALDISWNEIGDTGAWDIAWALSEEGTRLKRLGLARNEIENDGAAEICTALEGRHSAGAEGGLECLDLNGNRIGGCLHPRLEALNCAVRIGFQFQPRAEVVGVAAAAA